MFYFDKIHRVKLLNSLKYESCSKALYDWCQVVSLTCRKSAAPFRSSAIFCSKFFFSYAFNVFQYMVAWLKLSSLLELYLKHTNSMQAPCRQFTIRFNKNLLLSSYVFQQEKYIIMSQCLCRCSRYLVHV